MKPSELWKQRLEQTPGLAPYLEPIAKKWAKGPPLPKTMTLGPEPRDPELRRALERIFGEVRYRDGKTVATLPQALHDDVILAELAGQLGIRRKQEKKPGKTVPAMLQRIRLIHPNSAPIHHWMAGSSGIDHFLSGNPDGESILLGLLKTAARLSGNSEPVTLSKLGSIFFNDSKFLRNKNGTPYNLLAGMMTVQLDMEDSPENRGIALQQFGVVDNPATTTATLFGPVSLVRSGHPAHWIAERYQANEPATLNSYNLEKVDAVHLPEGFETVITSENAAPFHDLVNEKQQAVILYTGGYPNALVCRLLQFFHEAGAACKHWGDTDPDGLFIAALVDRYIETSLFRCDTQEILRHQSELKPLKLSSSLRARNYLKSHPHFRFRDELELALETGRWLEQERWRPPR